MSEDSISIIYEDADVVVVDKPVGMLVHAGEEGEGVGTIVSWFIARTPEAKGVGEASLTPAGKQIERSGVVHRLDRETSGVLILAKHQAAFAHLKQQFHDRLALKEYRAFVYGKVQDTWGSINRPIGRSRKDFRLRSAQRGAQGMLRSAITEWELITQNATHSYVRVFPKTGRTHQIRVHLKAINHPIVCDRLYAPNVPCELGFGRLALHAHTLTLTLPSGVEQRFESPIPHSFEAAEALIRS